MLSRFVKDFQSGFYRPLEIRCYLLGFILAMLLITIEPLFPQWWGTILCAYALLFISHVQIIFQIETRTQAIAGLPESAQVYYRLRRSRLKSFYLFYTFVLLSIALAVLKKIVIYPLNVIWGYYLCIAIVACITALLCCVYWDYRVRKLKPSQAVFPFFRKRQS